MEMFTDLLASCDFREPLVTREPLDAMDLLEPR